MKKVLIISYYFPPMGMGGVQRTAKFAKYLGKFGWQPYVLTVTPKLYLASDNCLLHEMEQSGVKIYRTGSGEVNGDSGKVVKFKKDSNRKLLSNISQTFLLPDSKIFWKSSALTLAEKIVKDEGIDMIFATAPPYTDFLIACELKEKTGLPVVADYRDSWIDCPNNFYPTPLHKNIHRKMETHVLEFADKVITINDRIKELIHLRYPFVKDDKVMVIPQGFDPEDFDKTKHVSKNKAPGKMRITYSGSFLNYYTPKYFLDALKQAVEKVPEMRSHVEACFVGTFPEEYRQYIKTLGIEECINITGYVEHSVCTSYLRESHALWMMINKSERSDLHSTGKLYEYLGAGKPILACVPEGVARKSLEGHGASILTEPDDTAAITDALISLYNDYKKDSLPVPSDEMTSQYDRKKLASKLAVEFTKLAEINSHETVKV